MVIITVKYRNKDYAQDIDPSIHVLTLKTNLAKLYGIQSKNFSLQNGEIQLRDDKEVFKYLTAGTVFTIINVKITVYVNIDGIVTRYNVSENMSINQFARSIAAARQRNADLKIYLNGQALTGITTLFESGVKHHSTVSTSPGIIQKNSLQKVAVKYRDCYYYIIIDERNNVEKLKEEVSKLTDIEVKNFSLKVDNIYAIESKVVSQYISDGNTFVMANVIIKVNVIIKGKDYLYYVKEIMSIDEFQREIITQSNQSDIAHLYYDNRVLEGNETILSSGLENNSYLIAVLKHTKINSIETITVKYRYKELSFDIDPSIKVLLLKNLIYEKLGILPEHFSLQFHWLPLLDTQQISEYLKYGYDLTMTNVTIKIGVKLNQKNYTFLVKEYTSIEEFINKVIEKTGHKTGLTLFSNHQKLVGKDSLLNCEVEHDGVILAVSTLAGGNFHQALS